MGKNLEAEALDKENAALEPIFIEMKSGMSSLESRTSRIESMPQFTAKTEARINGLKLRVAKLESTDPSSISKGEESIRNLEKRHFRLEEKLVVLTAAIQTASEQLKWKKEEVEMRYDGVEKDRIRNPNDLVGVFVVLVFVVLIFIGLNV